MSGSADRLESWKEIAAYLNREVRTVQRWEKHEGLPVNRLTHKKLGSVYASRSEIDAWSAQRSVLAEAPAGSGGRPFRRALLWALAGIGALVVCGAVLVARRMHTEENRPLKFRQITTDTGLTYQPALSPNGKLVAYASDRGGTGNLDIWIQQTSRSTPERLTSNAADDYEPAFSPDGKLVVFHSDRDGGGIYAVPASGGEAVKLAGRGWRPRYSPDGKWLAYWDGMRRDRGGDIFVVPAAGGESRRVQITGMRENVMGRSPVWAPDSTHLLFGLCTLDSPEKSDWYVAGLAGGEAIRTGAFRVFQQRGLSPSYSGLTIQPDVWFAGAVTFSANSGDSTNLWEIAISPETWQVTGVPRRLTSGTGLELHSSASARGLLAFSSLLHNVDIWSLPLDSKLGTARGEMQRLTSNAADDLSPSISWDGRRLAFESLRTGQRLVWTKDLATGHEEAITETSSAENLPRISPDGLQVAYMIIPPKGVSGDLYIRPFVGGQPTAVCKNCDCPWGWSGDGRRLLYGDESSLTVWELAASKRYQAVERTGHGIYSGHFSPDDRWIMFTAQSGPQRDIRTFAVPFRKGETRRKADWIPLSEDWGVLDPGGAFSYFISTRDGFPCLWSMRLNQGLSANKDAQPVCHFHRARLSPHEDPEWRGLGVARDKAVFALTELTGNIWVAERESSR